MKDIIAGQSVQRRKRHSLLSMTSTYRITNGSPPYIQIDQNNLNTLLKRQQRKRNLLKFLLPSRKFKPKIRSPRERIDNRERVDKNQSTRQNQQKQEMQTGVEPIHTLPQINRFLLAGGIAAFLLLTSSLFFIFTRGEQDFSLAAPEDELFTQELASYAGLLNTPEETGEESGLLPLDLIETFAWKSYTVRNGDSISTIAKRHGLSLDAIIASNNISNARRLRAGEKLRIPNMDGITYTVKKGDSYRKISSAMGVPLEAILDANDIQSDAISTGTVLFIPGARMKKEDLRLALGELFIYPIRGRISSPFGWRNDPISGIRKHHWGLDLAAPKGTVIRAASDGTVSAVGYNSLYGNYVYISHPNGYQTMYAHMSVISVRKGAVIYQGNKVGEVGSTGYSTGAHLHFAVYKNSQAINPLEVLNK
jgi:murein DD-endopeptidase MepM/ murein hydrolase activator NlpD